MITIVHPFHPDNGKSYECIERIQTKLGERVRCLDQDGKLRIFPINITNLYITDFKEVSDQGDCKTSVDDLLTLKELVDALMSSHECK